MSYSMFLTFPFSLMILEIILILIRLRIMIRRLIIPDHGLYARNLSNSKAWCIDVAVETGSQPYRTSLSPWRNHDSQSLSCAGQIWSTPCIYDIVSTAILINHAIDKVEILTHEHKLISRRNGCRLKFRTFRRIVQWYRIRVICFSIGI